MKYAIASQILPNFKIKTKSVWLHIGGVHLPVIEAISLGDNTAAGFKILGDPAIEIQTTIPTNKPDKITIRGFHRFVISINIKMIRIGAGDYGYGRMQGEE